MSNKKDMKRADLVVPYVEPKTTEDDKDMMSSMSTMLPMVAMFTRNRMIAWTGVLMATQGWLAETPEQKRKSSSPSWLSIIMALSSAAVTYMPLFLPPQPARGAPAAAAAT